MMRDGLSVRADPGDLGRRYAGLRSDGERGVCKANTELVIERQKLSQTRR